MCTSIKNLENQLGELSTLMSQIDSEKLPSEMIPSDCSLMETGVKNVATGDRDLQLVTPTRENNCFRTSSGELNLESMTIHVSSMEDITSREIKAVHMLEAKPPLRAPQLELKTLCETL
ncbi:hypothetical protein ACOSQ3_016831 [Xanthoceras sorbifolium]